MSARTLELSNIFSKWDLHLLPISRDTHVFRDHDGDMISITVCDATPDEIEEHNRILEEEERADREWREGH